MNPASSLTITEVPDLRLIDDELWQQVKLRQQGTRLVQREGVDRARKPKFLFSKLTKCGFCGGGFTTESRDELRCHNYCAAGVLGLHQRPRHQAEGGRAAGARRPPAPLLHEGAP